jgi:hypothetical protein
MQEDQGLDGNEIVSVIAEGLLNALVDWWYVWLLLVALIIGFRLLADWSKRVERRARAERRAKDRVRAAAGKR